MAKTRAKLSVAMTGIFIERLKTIDYDIDRVWFNNLRLVHGLLSECVDQSATVGATTAPFASIGLNFRNRAAFIRLAAVGAV